MQYRPLGRTGLRVAPIALGAMRFGAPTDGPNLAESRAIFDRYAEAGGNFIDTAHVYNEGASERVLADLLAGQRDHFVVSGKAGMVGAGGDRTLAGASRKAIFTCIEESLERLRTDRLDILYLHMWDFQVAVDEVVGTMADLVRQGRILHYGLSNVPAWVAARCYTFAEREGLPRPAALQVPYSLAARGVERELLPMARDLGIGVAAWGALGQGRLAAGQPGDEIAAAVAAAAAEHEVSPAQAALAWLFRPDGFGTIPVVGASTPDEVSDCLAALDQPLREEALCHLSEVSGFVPDYPYGLLEQSVYRDLLTAFDPEGVHGARTLSATI